jgi:hypothetical protein
MEPASARSARFNLRARSDLARPASHCGQARVASQCATARWRVLSLPRETSRRAGDKPSSS